MAKERGILSSLLWWTTFFILWYAGITMWLAALISFFVGWILGRSIERLGIAFIGYKITPKQLIMDLPVDFSLSKRKRLLSLVIPIRQENVRAEIRYYHEETAEYPIDTMPKEAIWRENGQREILINQEGLKHIANILTYPDGKPATIDGKLLPPKFTADIRIKGARSKERAHFRIPSEVN